MAAKSSSSGAKLANGPPNPLDVARLPVPKKSVAAVAAASSTSSEPVLPPAGELLVMMVY